MSTNLDLLSREDSLTMAATAQKRWPATVVLAIPFALIFIPLYRSASYSVRRKAAVKMLATFECIMICAELFSVSRGHWVWNPSRTLGIFFFGVPIEEPLLYYWFPPLLVVVLMHVFENYIRRKDKIK